LSIVFDARKHAERSKRAREAIAAQTAEPAESRPQPSVPQDPVPNPQESRTESQSIEKARRCNSKTFSENENEVRPRTALGLSAKRRARDWRVRWNRSAVANATRGRLTISDGTAHKELQLGAGELLDGSIIYTPEASDVVLRLEVVTSESLVPSTESLRLVGDASTGQTGIESDGAGGKRASSHDLRAADAARDMSGQLMLPIVGSLLRTRHRPSRAEERAGTETTARTSPETDPQISKIQPAALVFSAEPPYPQTARDSQISGSVEIRFRISPEGKVYDARPVRGPAVLARAAIEAVQNWNYAPARLHGAPIDSQGRANFEFKLSEQ
jgi:TonB family protein